MENIKIQKALKNMVDHMVILNDDEILSSSTLSTMAIDALCEDSEYCDLVDRDSAEAYLDKIVNFLDSKGLTFYTTNILDIEICSECGAVLLPDDECYQDHETGLPLCDKCSVQCRGCGNAIARSKVSAGAEYYCQSCNANTSNNNPNQNTCFNANDYTTHQLLEIEFQNVPNSTHKDNLIDEALQLVEECGYAVGEAANEVKVPICEDQKESILDELKCSEYKHLATSLIFDEVSITDDSCDQLNVELAEDVYLFSQATFLFEGEKSNYHSEILDFKDFEDSKIQKDAINGFYDSVEQVKEYYGDDWKLIVMECAFEQTCMTV